MTERRILFCTVGATPQVVTETAWALLDARPAECRVTRTGDRNAESGQ